MRVCRDDTPGHDVRPPGERPHIHNNHCGSRQACLPPVDAAELRIEDPDAAKPELHRFAELQANLSRSGLEDRACRRVRLQEGRMRLGGHGRQDQPEHRNEGGEGEAGARTAHASRTKPSQRGPPALRPHGSSPAVPIRQGHERPPLTQPRPGDNWNPRGSAGARSGRGTPGNGWFRP